MPANVIQLKFIDRQLPVASPFVKWVGGKRRVLPELLQDLPSNFGHYYEPFIGGGALFFHLRSHGLLMDHSVTLSDINLRLIRTYRAVRDDVEGLIDRLAVHQERHSPEHFYAVRATEIDQSRNDADVGAWFIYLNKTAFNGLYRVNKRNKFNEPLGRYKNPNICDMDNLRASSILLQTVRLEHAYFDHMRAEAQPNDLMYFDPPYVPASASANFTSYTENGFGSLEQMLLRDLSLDLKESGAHVLLSNADHSLVREWYKDFKIRSIQVGRSINCKGNGRGKVGEVIIR